MADGMLMESKGSRPRKANEYFTSGKQYKAPEKLFDEFWRSGELALFFGAGGSGKSILAMQIAEAVARGRAIDGFVMGEKRQKVLYVDLRLSGRQFDIRYRSDGKPYKFSENFYRDKPGPDEKLVEWLRKVIAGNGFRCVVIDDLSAIRQTFDGTRETLKLMRELRELKDELDVSMLVLAGAREPRPGCVARESDMQRSRVLCDAADSVFGIGLHPNDPRWRCIVQTRASSAAPAWHQGNAPACYIERSDDGFLCFRFDERFTADVDQQTRESILNVKWRRDAGASYRCIADELGMSKSTAFRLCKRWTPALEKGIVFEPEDEIVVDAAKQGRGDAANTEELEEWEECGLEKSVWLEVEEEINLPRTYADSADKEEECDPRDPRSSAAKSTLNPSAIPFAVALRRIPIKALKPGYDGYGREMFILEEQNDGKPTIWYQYEPNGTLIRKKRGTYGITIDRPELPWVTSPRVSVWLDFISKPAGGVAEAST
jgi:hypothetical protein